MGAAPRAGHLIGLLGRIVEDITVFPIAEAFTDEERISLEAEGVRISTAPVASVERHDDGVRIVAGSEESVVAGVFVASGTMRQRAPFAADLGVRMLESGAIEIDEFGRTSLPGVFAAGDLAHRASLPGPMASVLLAAGAGQLRSRRHHPVTPGCRALTSAFESRNRPHPSPKGSRLRDSNGGQTAPTSTAPPVAAGSA